MNHTHNCHFFYNGPYCQWYSSPIIEGDKTFFNGEQYMMYHKALLFHDYNTAEKIYATKNPAHAKSLGRQIKGFNNELWHKHREAIVFRANYYKFTQNPKLRQILLHSDHSYKQLVEASPTDAIWGIGVSEKLAPYSDSSQWGLNLLGKILMQVRQILRNLEF